MSLCFPSFAHIRPYVFVLTMLLSLDPEVVYSGVLEATETPQQVAVHGYALKSNSNSVSVTLNQGTCTNVVEVNGTTFLCMLTSHCGVIKATGLRVRSIDNPTLASDPVHLFDVKPVIMESLSPIPIDIDHLTITYVCVINVVNTIKAFPSQSDKNT